MSVLLYIIFVLLGHHHRKLIEAGVCHLHWDVSFLFCFLTDLRKNYEALFKKHEERNIAWDHCSHDGTKLGVYKEVSI